MFEKIRERVKRVQDDRDSAGPVRHPNDFNAWQATPVRAVVSRLKNDVPVLVP